MSAAAALSGNRAAVDKATGRVLEDASMREVALRDLRGLMRASLAAGHVTKYPRDDDQFLLAFLRARKYNVEKAHEVLNNFSKFWFRHRELIHGMDVDSCRSFLDQRLMRMLPGKDIHGNTITALYAGSLDFGRIDPRAQLCTSLMLFFNILEDEDAQLHGMTMIETFEGFSLFAAMGAQRHMEESQKGLQKEMMTLVTDTVPMRLRDIHVVKQPWYFSMFYYAVKPFLKAKLTKRVHMHGSNLGALHSLIAPQHLPPEFGGTYEAPFHEVIDGIFARATANRCLGGFALPIDVDDPTGARRRAEEVAKAGAAAATATVPPPAAVPSASASAAADPTAL